MQERYQYWLTPTKVTSVGGRRSNATASSHVHTVQCTAMVGSEVAKASNDMLTNEADCTYDQPSNRRRNPAPQYIEALEHRLQKAEMIIRTALPNIELDDPKFDAHSIEQILASSAQKIPPPASKPINSRESAEKPEDGQLESMITNTGSLDIDDRGYYDYHGNSSGVAFMRKLKPQFGDITIPDPRYLPYPRRSQTLESPRSTYDSPLEVHSLHHADLPSREIALELCGNTLNNCCALNPFVHKPTFYERLHGLYNADPDHYTNADTKFLPLLYSVIAVGCLYSKKQGNDICQNGYEKAVERGYVFSMCNSAASERANFPQVSVLHCRPRPD